MSKSIALSSLLTMVVVLSGCVLSSPPSSTSEGASSAEAAEKPATKRPEIPTPPENSDHGYLLDDARIPIIDTCAEWKNFWRFSGPAMSFEVAEQYPELIDLEVSTQIYLKNLKLDPDKNGVICWEGAPSQGIASSNPEISIPMPGENSDHGYLVEVSRIPKVETCDEWFGFWRFSGPAVSFEIAAKYPEVSDLQVSTQMYVINKHLDQDLDGILCFESDGSSNTLDAPVDVVEQVVKDIRSFRESAEETNPRFKLNTFAGPKVPDDVFEHYVEMVERASLFWAQFNDGDSLVQSVTVVANDEKKEFDQRIAELGMGSWGSDMWNRSGGGGGTVGTNSDGYSQVFFRLGPGGGDKPYDDYAYHEVTHSYQDLFETFDPKTGGPCWFPEGYAKLVGHANTFVDNRRNLSIYRESRDDDIRSLREYFTNQGGNLSAQLSEVLRYTHSHRQCNTDEPLFGYRLGWLVSEAWVAEFGFERTVNFMKSVKKGAFVSRFEQEFGISMDEWLSSKAMPYVIDALSEN